MAQRSEHDGRRKTDIKGPLVISVVLAVVAFVVVSTVAAGGTENTARVGLGLIAAGIAFIASVVVCATLMLLEKPNAEELGQGTGVNRSSAKIFAENKARREAERARTQNDAASGTAERPAATTDEPEFGQRVRPDTTGEEPGSSAR
ncbi:hypothetical protein KVA01_10540 [Kocuria varians]|uniref:Uncharacterized protein n=1 Tax=Kocuria varians TaxID=1272 RepID=A0A4Y4D4L4_KOCVA|nr:hypothetical protein [Kocuria varians]GEC98899.1 hypothetical protein KVA01_10540 [Kocuria varians]